MRQYSKRYIKYIPSSATRVVLSGREIEFIYDDDYDYDEIAEEDGFWNTTRGTSILMWFPEIIMQNTRRCVDEVQRSGTSREEIKAVDSLRDMRVPPHVFLYSQNADLFRLICALRDISKQAAPPLSIGNVHVEGKICFGGKFYNSGALSSDPRFAYNYFWSSNFNRDLTPMINTNPDDFEGWESRLEKACDFKLDYTPLFDDVLFDSEGGALPFAIGKFSCTSENGGRDNIWVPIFKGDGYSYFDHEGERIYLNGDFAVREKPIAKFSIWKKLKELVGSNV